MEKQFHDIGLSAERVSAVRADEVTITTQPLASHSLMRMRPPLVREELACLESHAIIWRRIVDEGLPMALVLEDDVRISKLLPEFLGHLDKNSSPTWDLMRLETWFEYIRMGKAVHTDRKSVV